MGRFGWDGISMLLPEGWQPNYIEYQPKLVMMRFEDERNAERLQLKVQQIKGRFSVERNMATIEKGIRKARSKSKDLVFSTGVTIPMVKKTFRGRPFATFGWKEQGLVAWGLLIFCEKCQQASILQVVSGKDEDDPAAAGKMLSSFTDHTEGDTTSWCAYGVEFEAPRSFKHADYGYDPRGLFRVTLKHGRESLSVLRWNLANLMLKKTDLEGFARASFVKDFRRYNLVATSTDFVGHPAITLAYDTSRLLARIKVGVRRWIRALKPAFMSGILWHCTKSNRLFSVHLLSDALDQTERIKAFAKTVRCCSAATQPPVG